MSGEPIVPIVVDTNVLVPSLYRKTHILSFLLSGNLLLVWNNFIYFEACKIINRLSEYYKLKNAGIVAEDALTFLDHITSNGRMVSEMPDKWPNVIVNDRSDDNFLWVAVTGKAEYIVSDDKSHILTLGNFSGIPIGTPGEFFSWVQQVHPWPGASPLP